MASKANTQTTINTTRTSTSTSSKSAKSRRSTRIPATPTVFQQTSALWANMNGDQKNSYAAVAASIADPLAPSVSPNRSGFNTFIHLSSANIAAGQPLLSTAAPYVPAPGLPPFQLLASVVNGKLSLVLVTNTPYPHPIALKAAKPLLASSTIYKSTAFKKIGSVPAITDHIDITALYETRYRVPGTGYKIAIELMGVAPGGYHTPGLFVIGIVSGVAQEAVYTGPETADSTPATQLKLGYTSLSLPSSPTPCPSLHWHP